MPKYRSWSDTAQRGFEEALENMGVWYESKGVVVRTDEDMDDLASDWGLSKENRTDDRRSIARHS